MALVLCIGADDALMATRRLLLEKAGHRVLLATSSRQVSRHCAEYSIQVAVIGHAVPAFEKRLAFDLLQKNCPKAKVLELHERGYGPHLKEAHRHLVVGNLPSDLPDAVSELASPQSGKRGPEAS
jgi:DNA-binding NtrC family response regulator